MKPDFLHTISFLFILFTSSLVACSQDSSKGFFQRHEIAIGSTVVSLYETQYKTDLPFQLLQLHHDEATADSVARKLSTEFAINYLQILNDKNRLIDFKFSGSLYRFDPNRIFSKEGIIASLNRHSQDNEKAVEAVEKFQEKILQLLDTNKIIIAVHNNSDGGFTLDDYVDNLTGLVHRNPAHDPDDFFITTDSTLFNRLREKNFNVVLEWSEKLKDDGSLSIYCSRRNISYVNVEAEHGHYNEQAAMLQTLIEILK